MKTILLVEDNRIDEVLCRLRAHPATKDLAISIFSGSMDTDDLLKSEELGVTAYVRKSSDLTEYARAIRQLVSTIK